MITTYKSPHVETSCLVVEFATQVNQLVITPYSVEGELEQAPLLFIR